MKISRKERDDVLIWTPPSGGSACDVIEARQSSTPGGSRRDHPGRMRSGDG
ncbi:hypothetical protein [Nocardia niwae]|uniref:hypothetical protein n=1 Tax=Nocardia niwae TaxID=626084 RepID=UPI000A3EC889|nr:hypothetical protein [Nocardia niwae]